MNDNQQINGKKPQPKRNTRVPVEDMEPLERLLYDVGMDVYGLACVMKECHWTDLSIPVDDYPNHVGKLCPCCAAPLVMPMPLLIDTILLGSAKRYVDKHGENKLTTASMIVV